jgi:hypothetical protein
MAIFAISLWLFTPILASAQSSNRTVVVISHQCFAAAKRIRQGGWKFRLGYSGWRRRDAVLFFVDN